MSEVIVRGCYLQPQRIITDPRGSLLPIEAGKDVPFAIRRLYFLYATTPGEERGFHAHRLLEQRAICIAGSCVVVVDDGTKRAEVRLDSPASALHLGAMVWHEIKDFSADCVLAMLASEHYDEMDYIRDYDGFLAEVSQTTVRK
jgi:dTDP-4-dehydrorhamnose 3,5-epimerase